MSESKVLSNAEGREGKPKVKKSDYFFYCVFYPVFKLPLAVTPNHISYARLILCVPLSYLMVTGHLKTAGALFIFMALMDGLDGSMARMRGQITSKGKVVDPIADKGQTITVLVNFNLLILVVSYFWLSLLMIGIDITLLLVALLQYLIHDVLPKAGPNHWLAKWLSPGSILRKIKVKETGANNWGKGKMVVLVITLSAMLLFHPNADYFIFSSLKLPWHLTMYNIFYQQLLAICVVLGLMSLRGHLKVFKFQN